MSERPPRRIEPGTPREIVTELESTLARTWRDRRTHRTALETCGYSALLVHSGSLLTVFEDDRTYPFEAHAPFKVWTPLSDVPDCFVYFEPGNRPDSCFQPARGLLVQGRRSCRRLTGRGISTSARPPISRPRASICRRTSQRPPISATPFPSSRLGCPGDQPSPAHASSRLWSRRENSLRAGLYARGEPAGSRWDTLPPPGLSQKGASEFEIELAFLQRLRTAGAGAALQPHHRAE